MAEAEEPSRGGCKYGPDDHDSHEATGALNGEGYDPCVTDCFTGAVVTPVMLYLLCILDIRIY